MNIWIDLVRQMDIRFLTKQLLLMGNMVRDYWIQVDKDDWQQLLHLVTKKQSYLSSVIVCGPREHQRAKAEQALECLIKMLYDKLVKYSLQAKSV